MSLLQQVYAQGGSVPTEVSRIQLGNISSLSDAFGLVINVILGVGVALTIIFLILGGIQYITSKGDQKAAQDARTSLTNAVIGFIVVIGAFTIRTVLLSVIGVDEGQLDVENVTPTF